MKQVQLTKLDFEQVVWPAVHKLGAKDVQEITVVAALSGKLKRLGTPRELNAQERELEAQGEVVFPDYRVAGPVTLLVEDEEWRVLKDRLRKWLPQMTGYAAELFLDLLDRVDNAKPPVAIRAVEAAAAE